MVLEVLDRALESLPPDNIDGKAQKVLDERKANIEKLGKNPFGQIQQSPPPHTSPSSQRQTIHYTPPNSPTPAPATKKAKMLSESKDGEY